jgi:hypothetical protein
MRLSDAGLRDRKMKLIYLNHLSPNSRDAYMNPCKQ